jgi:hypothetical protein
LFEPERCEYNPLHYAELGINPNRCHTRTPESKVAERRTEYPGIEVLPISFAASELKASHWRFLMGAVGSQSMETEKKRGR